MTTLTRDRTIKSNLIYFGDNLFEQQTVEFLLFFSFFSFLLFLNSFLYIYKKRTRN